MTPFSRHAPINPIIPNQWYEVLEPSEAHRRLERPHERSVYGGLRAYPNRPSMYSLVFGSSGSWKNFSA